MSPSMRIAAVAIAIYILLDFTIAITPKRYQTEKWFGIVLRLFRIISTHVHFDEPGTSLVVPIFGIPIRFGASPTPAKLAPAPPSTAPTVFMGDDAITPVDRKSPPPSA